MRFDLLKLFCCRSRFFILCIGSLAFTFSAWLLAFFLLGEPLHTFWQLRLLPIVEHAYHGFVELHSNFIGNLQCLGVCLRETGLPC